MKTIGKIITNVSLTIVTVSLWIGLIGAINNRLDAKYSRMSEASVANCKANRDMNLVYDASLRYWICK